CRMRAFGSVASDAAFNAGAGTFAVRGAACASASQPIASMANPTSPVIITATTKAINRFMSSLRDAISFVAERINRLERTGAHRRVDAKEQADGNREGHRQENCRRVNHRQIGRASCRERV